MAGSVCVYCGSNPGFDPVYREAAEALGAEIGRRGMRLVYGGSHLGTMGILADAVLRAGGAVTGVVPRLLVEKEAAYTELADLRLVETMHERKKLMADLADGFVALPGGYGTLDETFEALTWTQLGLQVKPVVFWDVAGYYGALFQFLDSVVAAGMMRPLHRALARRAGTLEDVFAELARPVEPGGGKWIPGDLR